MATYDPMRHYPRSGTYLSVGELRKALEGLPEDLPVCIGFVNPPDTEDNQYKEGESYATQDSCGVEHLPLGDVAMFEIKVHQ